MILKDKIDFQGHFSIKIFKKDGTIEKYEEKNLIMSTARSNMAELVGGWSAGKPIDRFVLGNAGHNGTDILDYKKVGTNDFNANRTQLFSQEDDGGTGEHFTYVIDFDCVSTQSLKVDDAAEGSIEGDISGLPVLCEVSRLVADRTCTYVITIPDGAGNKVGEGAVVAYTEAALYAQGDIFSMKTFPARVKEDTVKFEITWSIIF